MKGYNIMNMNIKNHHMSRTISSIKVSKSGMILILFEPQEPFDGEFLLFFPEELSAITKEILLIGAISVGDGPFADSPGDDYDSTAAGPEIEKDGSVIFPQRNTKKG